MKIHRLNFTQILPVTLTDAWAFFSSPANLNDITPPGMSFEIISGADEKMYAGQIVTYRIKPVLSIPMRWVTEITHCVEKSYFVDEQRFGPYKFWHHLHTFREVQGGVLMSDVLHYALPYGMVGETLGNLFIHHRVNQIFQYRIAKLNDLFKNNGD